VGECALIAQSRPNPASNPNRQMQSNQFDICHGLAPVL